MNYFHENDLFKTLYDAIPFDTYVVDVNSYEIIYMNKAMVNSRGNFTGKTCYKALFEEDKPCIHCKNKQLVCKDGTPNGQSIVFENFNPYDDRWYQYREKCVGWPDGRTVKCSVAVDISELKETQNRLAEAHAELVLKSKELEALSVTDKLTGLYNRLKLDETLLNEEQRVLRYKSRLSIILMDIDHFKRINDKLGHQAGDKVLQEVSKTIRDNVRKTDIVGRWGGEEFLIICPETGLDGVYTIAAKIREKLMEWNQEKGISATASFGVAQLAKDENSADLIRKADRALYQAKECGRNCVKKGKHARESYR